MHNISEHRGLLALPTELIHTILLALPPQCIERFSQTCKLARHHVYGNNRTGDVHLWKQLYLQRFDDLPSLWDTSADTSDQHISQGIESEHESNAPASSSSAKLGSAAPSSSGSASSSIMSLVQLRDRAARLYAGEPKIHRPLSLNFNAVLSALLSVVDTAVPQDATSCRNTIWLQDSVLSSGQETWSEWVFPRTIMYSLDEFKMENTANSSIASSQERKRRRLAGDTNTAQNDANTPMPAATASSSRDAKNTERPDSTRRRSARLLKLMYPQSLHGLVDEGVDIDALAQPQMRLAARLHCLHGIRTWKDSQRQRLTASPQEIPRQHQQQDGLANDGAPLASAQNASTLTDTGSFHPEAQAEFTQIPETTEDASVPRPASEAGGDSVSSVMDEDDESFDEPPAAILRYRPRMFGPSFGFCSAPDEEDEVRARMRHRVYDSGYYAWSNGYAPLHAWRHNPDMEQIGGEDEGQDFTDDDVDTTHRIRRYGSQDGDDDAFLEAAELSDQDIPDDPVPIEIELSRNGDPRRTFQIADRFGNPIESSAATERQTTGNEDRDRRRSIPATRLYGNPVDASEPAERQAARGWDSSDDEGDAQDIASHADISRALYQEPDLGNYDANTATYTYEGDLPIGIVTGSSNIQVTVGNTIDFIASGELQVRFIRPGMLAETMRVTSGQLENGNVGDQVDGATDSEQVIVEEDDDQDHDADDDYDDDADDWNDFGGVDEDDDNFGPFFEMFMPLAGAGYQGCHADEEIRHLVVARDAERAKAGEDERSSQQAFSLRRKSIHWELVEAIMVVMYANLKEAIWLENWGVGIRIPKVYDPETGVLVRDPMEKREFLDFPTGWNSSLPSLTPSKLNAEATSDEASSRKQASSAEAPQVIETAAASNAHDDKPYDWARCESFWGGTYAFLDYTHFVDFNVRLLRRRAEALARAEAGRGEDGKQASSGNANASNSHLRPVPKPSLVGQEEAVGDCLQLRLELLPKSQQPAYNADEEGQEQDEEYPTLYFRGTTVTFWGNEAPMPRGGVHGKVRPVYAREEDVDEILSKGPRGKKKIEGLHWSLTHVYEGEDRWQLEGVQPGPPGSRAPIFGIWTDAMHEEQSPNGPFVYWLMDDRPWKEIERLNRQEAHNTTAARATGDRR